MLLSITTTHPRATDLGYLLHKHPGRFQSYDLSFGQAHVFYTEADDDRCTACLLLDVDPVGLVRGKGTGNGLLYVLIPVFDNQKHYDVGDDELEKLLTHGSTWLARHPQKEEITHRYLKFQPSLYRQALARLADDEDNSVTDDDKQDLPELSLDEPLSLNEQRLEAVTAALIASGA